MDGTVRRRLARALTGLSLITLLAFAPAAFAEPEGGQSDPDFRFSAPNLTFGVRVGWIDNRAEGEIFDFLTDELTLERSDFDAIGFGFDLGWRLSDRVDAVFGVEMSSREQQSEYRDFVDQNDIPIVQSTRLSQVPLTLSLKFYLVSRGESVGRYAYVPASFVPYVGGGIGATYYRLEQEGEFIDFTDLAIFEAAFESSGWSLAPHAFAGVDIKLSPSMGLILEGRYQWAEADLQDSYIGFDPIDLDGLRAMAGLNWKF